MTDTDNIEILLQDPKRFQEIFFPEDSDEEDDETVIILDYESE